MLLRLAAGWLTILGLLLAGCGTLGRGAPEPCEARFDASKCEAMAIYAASKLRIDRADIAAVAVLPDPTPEVRDGVTILQVRSGGAPLDVIVALRDGGEVEVSMDCGGIATGAQCIGSRLHPSTASDGYFDVPCGGEPPAGCPVRPTPDAEGLAGAVELRIEHLEVPVDGPGDVEIQLGEARLPNGILTEATFEIVDPSPDGLVILSNRIHLTVRSLEPDGRPFDNLYLRGVHPGAERVEVVLAFHVDAAAPGAVLSIANVVVR